ncbi:MAG: DNA alkylation repair protein, partial [Candidatus Levybacteria bacterium CG_4_10_14_0_2_um_filter_35_8]
EARLVAAFIEDPKLIDEKQMENWVADFDNWAICDTVCGSVFDKTSLSFQ